MTDRRPPTPDRSSTVAVRPTQASFPPHVLREYALLADGERGAVLGPAGDIVWMCAPRWDSDAVFTALIGGRGGYSITPVGRHVWGGYYEEGSMIWRNRWITDVGAVECRDALAYPADPHRAVLLRRLEALHAPATIIVSLEPRAGYDEHPLLDAHRVDGVWTGRTGRLWLRWTGAPKAHRRGNGEVLTFQLHLEPGQHHDLVLELSDQTLTDEPIEPDAAWRATEAAWRDAVPAFEGGLSRRDTRRSYAVLRGLTSTGGGMVAAATTSLPERAEAGRNYDYRYVWIRDQCYAGQAVAAAGPHPLLDDAVDFVADRLLEHGDHLAPAYTVTGDPVPDQHHLDLPGYPGGYDIVGNWVNQQFQLDAYGEALLLFAAAARHDRLDTRHWDAAVAAAGAIGRRWKEPDAGIWEIDNRPWTHSRLTAAAGLRAIAAAHPAPAQGAHWLTLADHIVADTSAHALHPDGHWQRSPDDPALDAALLLPGLRGAVPADDPRTVATLRAYLRDLTCDGYAYRFRHDQRPLGEAEGSFLLCGFLVALSLHQQGDAVEARAWYERTRAACGPPQLFSEEYDADQHQMRGNLPQAFVHALAIETATRLGRGDQKKDNTNA
ncbi:glycoside hydrolase family 15 protein [Jatrophihabitans lederbergiae]|uniref:Glycoside hydrolase family 15 protein n=1 Tax=Jatrophihabitans lederbergiae TaxID=3075547 RepID=A0ABU2JFC1_9ACTN|nr:glycoside hydrolase family 15 protein [Jatrophihabitans sp. DSM 44399]MDT0263695.1 glycoside hydrolase family 15 protein [Jatrophihabitans sp. DSM 44399]